MNDTTVPELGDDAPDPEPDAPEPEPVPDEERDTTGNEGADPTDTADDEA